MKLIIFSWILLAGCGAKDTYVYRMPDGAVCSYEMHSDGFLAFYECSSGLRYINPASYQRIRKSDL